MKPFRKITLNGEELWSNDESTAWVEKIDGKSYFVAGDPMGYGVAYVEVGQVKDILADAAPPHPNVPKRVYLVQLDDDAPVERTGIHALKVAKAFARELGLGKVLHEGCSHNSGKWRIATADERRVVAWRKPVITKKKVAQKKVAKKKGQRRAFHG